MNRKRIIKSIFILFLAFIGLLAINEVVGNYGLKHYLSKKYEWETEKISIIEYQKSHFDTDFGPLGLDASNSIWYRDRKWICEYNGRQFHVEYYLFRFMDDYQLEDIFKWCTEYLQENYDREVVGVEVYSDIIYHSPDYKFDYSLPWNSNKVFKKDDAKELMQIQMETGTLNLFYKVNSLFDFGDKKPVKYFPNNNYKLYRDKKKELLRNYKNTNIILVETDGFEISDLSSIGICYQIRYTSSDLLKGNYIFSNS